MDEPERGEYTDEMWPIVKELTKKMNALEHLQVKGTGISGKLTYTEGQWVLEIIQS